MKIRTRILALLAALSAAPAALAATFNLFSPAAGILKGNPSTYVTTAATSTDVVATFSGTCNSTTFLRGDGTCAASGGGVTGLANPTASLGLTAINGAATTAMRSDAAPALDVGISPTWTGTHTWSQNMTLTKADPRFCVYDSGSDATFFWRMSTDILRLNIVDGTTCTTTGAGIPMTITSAAGVVSSFALAATALTWNGSPMVNLASTPVWTGTHDFTSNGANLRWTGNDPRALISESDGGTDTKNWLLRAVSNQFAISLATDAAPFSAVSDAILISRTTTTPNVITLNGTVQNGSNLIPNVASSPTWSGTHTFSNVPVVPNDSWTYAKIQNVSATSRFLGRITAGAGDIEELTGTQGTTLLDVFTSGLKGLAPASGGGTTNFLRADGTWAAADGTPGGSDTAVQYNNAGAFGGSSTLFSWDNAGVALSVGSSATTGIVQGRDHPSAGTGGSLRVTAGNGGTNGQGGALTLRGGSGVGAGNNGGNVTIAGGVPADGNGGNININGQVGVGTSRAGSPISINGGDSTNAVTGGAITMDAGRGGPTGAGGALTLTAGQGGTTSGAGALATLRGGSGGGGGDGGGVAITGRNATGAANGGGSIVVTAGDGTTSGAAGNVTVTAGASPSGTDGSVILQTNGANTRLQIDGTGAFLVGGSAGTARDVLTSNGAGTPPTWQASAILTTSVGHTINGFSSSSGNILWTRSGRQVCVAIDVSGVSNATTFTITGLALPTPFGVSVAAFNPFLVQNNGGNVLGNVVITATQLTFGLAGTAGGFTASGSKSANGTTCYITT